MNMDSAFANVRDLLVDNNKWTQLMTIKDSNDNVIDLSVACGSKPRTPNNATEQPSQVWLYPQGSRYVFPHCFHGLESEVELRAMLSSQVTCPGAQLIIRSSNTSCSNNRVAEYTLSCTHSQHVGKLKIEKKN